MPKWNGGVIGVANNPTQSSAKGIWSLSEATKAIRAGLWPPSNAGADPYFENVTMLLSADGTNGAQNNTFLDSSTNAFTITRNGNTTQGTFTPFSKVDGRWGNYFDTTGDFLSFTGSSATNFNGVDWTIECWFFKVSLSGGNDAIIQSTTGTNSWVPYLALSTNNDRTIGVSLNAVNYSSTQTYNLNEWNHVAVVRSGGTIKVYLNGAATSISVTADITNSNLSFWIGKVDNAPGGGGYLYYFNGYISNLRILKGTAQYTAAFTPPTAPLTAITNTSLLTCQSNRFIDNSTNAFAITRNGDVSIQTFSPFPTLAAYASGTNGGSGYFDGTGDYLSVTNNAAFDFGSGDMTIECWFYITGNAALNNDSVRDACLFSSFPASGTLTTTYDLNVGGNGSTTGTGISFGRRASGTNTTLTYTATITQGSWHHVAVVRTSSTLSLYLDGSRVAQNTSFSGNIDSGGHTIRVGTLGFAGYLNEFPGYISGLRMLKGTAQYSGATYTIPTAPLTAITNTSLLCNFTNGGIVDAAMSNDLETAGGAQISTTQSKFGGASMYFDGTGDYLRAPRSPDYILSGDFTIEFWLYFTAHGNYGGIVSSANSNTANAPTAGWCVVFYSTTDKLYFEAQGGVGIQTTNALSTSTWTHCAIVRSGSTITHYTNGVANGSGTSSATFTPGTSDPLVIGSNRGFDSTMTGYIDDLRITKGYARYTANFTAPVGPFNGFGD
jgi:hypothetical protein